MSPDAKQRRLRIVVPRYGAEVIGGVENLMRAVATHLVGAGWAVEVWASCAQDERTWANTYAPGCSEDSGVVVRRFPVIVPRSPRLFAAFSRGFFRLPSSLRSERPWFTTQGPWNPSLVRSLRTAPTCPTVFSPYLYYPTVSGIHATRGIRVLQPAAHDERPLRLRAVERAVAAADAIWYSTPEERELLERVHPVASVRPAAVGTVGVDVPDGVDPMRFRGQLGVRGPYVLYAGRITPGKGIEDITAAFASLRVRHPETMLVVAGAPTFASRPEDGILSVGRIPERDLWDGLAGAAAAVVPSSLESLSLLALESWAVGCPVIVNGASPVLAGQAMRSGGALTYRGRDELAAAMVHLLTSPAEAARLGSAGREYIAQTYRWNAVVERLGELIEAAQRGRQQRSQAIVAAGQYVSRPVDIKDRSG